MQPVLLQSNQDKILTLMMGLPPLYGPIIINFNATPSELLTMNNVVACLLNEEVHQSGNLNVVKVPEESDKAMVVTGRGKGGHGVQNTAGPIITCFL